MNEVKDSHFYQLNLLVLRLAVWASLMAGLGMFTLQGGVEGRRLLYACTGLAILFAIVQRSLLPRVKEFWQLDLLVLNYHLAIYAVQWYSLYQSPELDATGGVVCVQMAAGLLIRQRFVFISMILLSSVSWLLVRDFAGVPPTGHVVMQLLVMGPLVSVVIRVGVLRIFGSLEDARRRELQQSKNLLESARLLEEETARRQESELRFLQAQKNESLGILAAGVAHDFNNALLAISVFAENLQMTSADEKVLQSSVKIMKAVDHASRICSQMLTYAGKPSGAMQSVKLNELVTEATPLLEASTHSQIDVRVTCEPEVRAITGNQTQLQQVLMNLVTNAAEAISGVGEITVSVNQVVVEKDLSNVPASSFGSPLRAGKYVVLEVSDTGCGISDELLLQMFDPYFTTKETGHGFGLSTVLGIVRSHKATMSVDSEMGEGTSITVMFPSQGMPLADSRQFRAPRQIVAEREKHSRRSILVVDDDDLVRVPMAQMLTLLDWDVEEVTSGFAAIEVLKAGKQFSVLLIDFKMPGLNGHQTLKAIREIGCDTPAILCSGYISSEDVKATISEFDDYLTKPFHRKTLQQKLEAVCAGA